MALLPQKANTPDNNASLADREPVPAGTYTVVIKTGIFKETKAKNGHYLSLMFVIVEGEFKGKSVFVNLNLDNPNQIAVEIATKELNSICQALNVQGVEDSDELLGQSLDITVKIEQKNPEYPPNNVITSYSATSSNGINTPAAANTANGDTAKTNTDIPEEVSATKLPWE